MTILSYPVMQNTKELYQSETPRRSACKQTICSRAGRPPTVLRTTADPNELDDVTTATTGNDTGDFVSALIIPSEDLHRSTTRTKLQRKRKRDQEETKPTHCSLRNNNQAKHKRSKRTMTRLKTALM